MMSIDHLSETPAVKTEREEDAPARIVKRYSNRKLYDTKRSRYVTLDDIARMIKEGEEVTVIDNESKEDLTSVTLTQIIYEQEKRENRMPLAMLRNLIQTGGSTIQEFWDSSMADVRDTVTEITDSARRLFSREERKAAEFRKFYSALFGQLELRLEERIKEAQTLHNIVSPQGPQPLETPSENANAERAPDPETAQRALEQVSTNVTTLREHLARASILVDRLERAAKEGADLE